MQIYRGVVDNRAPPEISIWDQLDASVAKRYNSVGSGRIVPGNYGGSKGGKMEEPHSPGIGAAKLFLEVAPALLLVTATAFGQGQIVGSHPYYEPPAPIVNEGFISVATSGWFPPGFHPYVWSAVGVRANGTMAHWGGPCDFPPCGYEPPDTDIAVISLSTMQGALSILHRDGSIWPAPPPGPNEGFVAVASGENHRLALRSDGSIVAWGLNDDGQCNVPEPNIGYRAIAAAGDVVGGVGYSLAINSSGSIILWGYNPAGQFDVPEPNMDFVSVAAGRRTAAGIKADGTAVVWGPDACDPPAPNSGFIAVACGGSSVPAPPMTLFLRDNGSIEICGGLSEPHWPEPNSGFVAIACAGWQGLAVRGQPTASISLVPEPMNSIRAFPNPFSASTSIIGLDRRADITIYNALGRSVRRLNDAQWDGLNEQGQVVAAGPYFAKVNRAGESQMVLRLVKVHN